MAKLKIITIPEYETQLRQPSQIVDIESIKSSAMQKFFDSLIETMLVADGAGLAAPQVNNPIRVCAVNMGQDGQIFINPKITKKSFLKNNAEEGCLSIPNIYGKVKRCNKITVEYLNRFGESQKIDYTDYLARVLQHEIDHLDGILFIDKMEK